MDDFVQSLISEFHLFEKIVDFFLADLLGTGVGHPRDGGGVGGGGGHLDSLDAEGHAHASGLRTVGRER